MTNKLDSISHIHINKYLHKYSEIHHPVKKERKHCMCNAAKMNGYRTDVFFATIFKKLNNHENNIEDVPLVRVVLISYSAVRLSRSASLSFFWNDFWVRFQQEHKRWSCFLFSPSTSI